MKTLEELEIIGGDPAVDFVNTLNSWTESDPDEYLHDFDDFVRWNKWVGLIEEAVTIKETISEAEKERAIQDVRRFRASMYALFAAIAGHQSLPDQALARLNDVVHRTVNWRRLSTDPSGVRVTSHWDLENAPAEAFLGPVAWKCSELLEHGSLDRLKICPADDCAWLFLDFSKNRSRQWCSMTTCGNAAKVRRFRQRKAAH